MNQAFFHPTEAAVRHPFTAQELTDLIEASGLLATTEPKAKDEFVRRINALEQLKGGIFKAFADLRADLYRGPHPDTASDAEPDPMTTVPWPRPDDRVVWAKSFELMALLDGWDANSINQVIDHMQAMLRGTMRLNCQGADFQRAVKVFVDLPAARG